MEIGLIGLGRMGAGMARRWLRGGHRVVVNNRSRGPIDELAADGAVSAYTVEDLVNTLATPRAIWMMLPAGDVTSDDPRPHPAARQGRHDRSTAATPTTRTISARASMLAEHGLNYVDQGTSGGDLGAAESASA